MKYSEIVELYKEGKLDEENKTLIEKDIERHEAISDYLYENEMLPEIIEDGQKDDTFEIAEKQKAEEEKIKTETEKIIRNIKRRFRRGFIAFAIILLVIVLIVVGIFEFVIPNWKKSMYYDPIGSNENDITQFERDMRVYTNLFAPDKNWEYISVTDLRSGNYSFNVAELCPDISSLCRTSNIDFSSSYYKEKYVSGKINQGNLEVNGSDVFSPRSSYPFYPALAGVSNDSRLLYFGARGDEPTTKTKDLSSVNSVNNSGVYNIYLTFDKVYSYEDAMKMLSNATKHDRYNGYGMMSLWFAACQKLEGTYEASTTLGFYASCNSYDRYISSNYLNHLYLACVMDDYYDSQNVKKNFEEYFKDSLLYIADNEDFTKMTGCNEIKTFKTNTDSVIRHESGEIKGGIYYPDSSDIDTRYECLSEYLRSFAANVEKNGIYVYGCYYEGVMGETVKELAKCSHISYIYTEQIA